jgi:hypothetical protein
MGGKMIGKIIRWVATLVLIYFVYQETGIWTSLTMFLIFVSFELQNILDKELISFLRKSQKINTAVLRRYLNDR